MKKFSIDWSLLGGFSALLFLIITMGLIGILQIHSLGTTVDNLGTRFLPMQSATLEMRINNSLYAMRIRNYVFWKGSRYLEAAKAATDLGKIEEVEKEFDKRDSLGIRTDKYKYFRFARNPDENVHLYDLKNDPFENINIAKGNEELIKEFETRISEIEKNEISHDDELSEEEQERISKELKRLGYM